jgi:MFS transporter, PAT family, beta-lactamase induction signal transducer AmpG
MQPSRNRRYAMFGLLYFSEGTVFSYFTALNALYLLSRGITMTNVGIFATIALIPFVIKVFLGMLSDKVNLFGLGHRKPYILIGLVVQSICLVIAPFIDPGPGYWWFVLLAFFLQMGMALYDTCTDGLALDTTPEEEQGKVQGIMVGGRAVGVVVTASAVGLLAQNVSWYAVFWLLAVLTLLPIPLVLGMKEAEKPKGREFQWSAFAAFKQVPVILLAVMGLIFFLVIAGANQIVNPFLQHKFNIGLGTAGQFTTVWGIGAVLGGALGGWLVGKIGRRNATLAALLVSMLSIASLAFTPSLALAWVLVFLFGVAYSTYQTVYFALAMGYTDARIAASMFAILMAMTNVGQGIGMPLAGLLVDKSSYVVAFLVLAGINLLALPLFPIVFGKKQAVAQAS